MSDSPSTASTRWWRQPWRAAQYIIAAVALLAVVVPGDAANDVLAYYGRLVHEFAEGRYSCAFFHMIPPLVPVLAGVVAKTGMEPFTALKAVSGLLFFLGLFPLRRLLARCVRPELADWGCVLYAVCPRLLRYGTGGTLEGAKVLFLLLCVQQAVAGDETRPWRRAAVLGAGMAGLSLSRGEGVFFVPLIACLAVVADLRKRRSTQRLHRVAAASCARALAAAALAGVLCVPWLVHEYNVTGYPCLDSRQVLGASMVAGLVGATIDLPAFEPPAPGTLPRPADRAKDEYTAMRSVREAVRGFFPFYLALAIVGLAVRFRRTALGAGGGAGWLDGVCGAVVLFNICIFAASGFITKRYVAATIPFTLVWVSAGSEHVLVRLRAALRERPQLADRLGRFLVGLTLVGCVWDGTSRIRGSWPPEPDVERAVGQWVAEHRADLDVTAGPALESARWGVEYHNGRQPVVATYTPGFAYWAQADYVVVAGNRVYPYDALVAACRGRHVDVLIVGDYFQRICPTFAAENRHFVKVTGHPFEDRVEVYRFSSFRSVAGY